MLLLPGILVYHSRDARQAALSILSGSDLRALAKLLKSMLAGG